MRYLFPLRPSSQIQNKVKTSIPAQETLNSDVLFIFANASTVNICFVYFITVVILNNEV